MLQVYMRPGANALVKDAVIFFQHGGGETFCRIGIELRYRTPPDHQKPQVLWESLEIVNRLPRALRGAGVVIAVCTGIVECQPRIPRFTLSKVAIRVEPRLGRFAYTVQSAGLSGIIEMLGEVDPDRVASFGYGPRQ